MSKEHTISETKDAKTELEKKLSLTAPRGLPDFEREYGMRVDSVSLSRLVGVQAIRSDAIVKVEIKL